MITKQQLKDIIKEVAAEQPRKKNLGLALKTTFDTIANVTDGWTTPEGDPKYHKAVQTLYRDAINKGTVPTIVQLNHVLKKFVRVSDRVKAIKSLLGSGAIKRVHLTSPAPPARSAAAPGAAEAAAGRIPHFED